MNETEFRAKIQLTFDSIERALESIDPDAVECVQSQGSLSLMFANGSKCILSVQPSVRQLWLANAAEGKAWHLVFDEKANDWIDDKGQGQKLRPLLQQIIKRQAPGVNVEI